MMKARSFLERLRAAEDAAVAPIVALSLFGLIGAAGVAFDYSRLVTLDTELQNAADQSALAAATQLNGKPNATRYAEEAARTLITNSTLVANDGATKAISIATVTFYADKAKTQVVVRDDGSSTDDTNAHYVQVTVGSRTAFYALTPVVGAFSSGAINAAAFAGLGSAVCKVPPVMLCNPFEPMSNTDENYSFPVTRGVGMKLITGDATTPGNFGWLESHLGPGASELAKALGSNSVPGDCLQIYSVTTKPGMSKSVFNAFDTRFDMFANGNQTCPDNGVCSPSTNSRKDLVCDVKNVGDLICKSGWDVSAKPYRPTLTTPLPSNGTQDPDLMGFPRDLCHAVPVGSQTCTIVGDGNWDRDAYFRVNYKWTTQAAWTAATGLSTSASRYDVYLWEVLHPSVAVGSKSYGIGVPQTLAGKSTGFGSPANGVAGVTPSATGLDRRRLSVAVLNCRALSLNGHASASPVRWLDVFLVEPPFNRSAGSGSNKKTYTTDDEVYVEVIGETGFTIDGASGGQSVRRDTPYLIE